MYPTESIHNGYDEIGNDNNIIEMKAQNLHPPQRREKHLKWWVPSRARTHLKRNLFCIEVEIPHNDEVHQRECFSNK